MKSIKKIATLAALLFAAASVWAELGGLAPMPGSPAKARPRTEEDLQKELDNYDKIALEYKDYFKETEKKYMPQNFGRYLDSLYEFSLQHPLCVSAYADYIKGLLMAAQPEAKRMAKEAYGAATGALKFVPDTKEGKLSKADYYDASARIQFLLFGDEAKAQREAELCAKANPKLAGKALYDFATFYMGKKDYAKALSYFQKSFELDPKLSAFSSINAEKALVEACAAAKKFDVLAAYCDKNMEGSIYWRDFGAFAMSAYEKAKQNAKAVLVSMLDVEYALAYSDTGADALIQILQKHFGKDKKAAPCIAFIKKFYDDKAVLTQGDVASLPENVRDFFPVRYMFKMKNSSDIEELKKEFDPFCGITLGNFALRLYDKAVKAGDKKAAADMLAKIELIETVNKRKTKLKR